MASRNFSRFALSLATGAIDFSGDEFRALIVSEIPTESNLDSWGFQNDVTTEITDPDYTAGGFVVTASVGVVDAANDRVPITFSAASPTYSDATISGVGCILYRDSGTAGTSELISFIDWNGTVSSTNGAFTVVFSTPLYIAVNPAQ